MEIKDNRPSINLRIKIKLLQSNYKTEKSLASRVLTHDCMISANFICELIKFMKKKIFEFFLANFSAQKFSNFSA